MGQGARVFQRAWVSLMKRWERLPLRPKGVVLAALPLLAILVSTAFATLGNRERERDETDVSRHFEFVSDLEELSLLIVDAETGMRGYVLTGRSEFLTPYNRAVRELPSKQAQLRSLVAQEPGLRPRRDKGMHLTRMENLIHAQMQLLSQLRGVRVGDEPTIVMYTRLQKGKQLMDALRIELRLMRSGEKRLLAERLSNIAYVRHRDYLAIGLTFGVGLIGRFVSMYLFNTGVVRRVHRARENVRRLGQSAPIPDASATTPDALGALEREIEELHTKLQTSSPQIEPS